MKTIFIASILLTSIALPSVACGNGNGNFMIDPSGRCINLSNMQPVSPNRRITRPTPQRQEYIPPINEQPRTPAKDPEVEKIKKDILNQPGHQIVPTPRDLRDL